MKKILIIDDEKPTREFIRRMLESFKLNAAIFIDGENVESGIKAIDIKEFRNKEIISNQGLVYILDFY